MLIMLFYQAILHLLNNYVVIFQSNAPLVHKLHGRPEQIIRVVLCVHEYDSTVDMPLPCFVASNIADLPPITFDSIDVSVLQLKWERLADDVTILKSGLQSHGESTQGLTDVCQDTAARIAELEHLSDRPHIERAQLTRNAVRNASVLPLLGRWAQSITNHVYWAEGHSRSRTTSTGQLGTVDHESSCLLGRWAQSITNHVYWAAGHSRSRTMSTGQMGTVDHEPRLLGRWAQSITNHVYWADGHSRSRTMSTGQMGTVDHEPCLLGRWAQSITNHVYWADGHSRSRTTSTGQLGTGDHEPCLLGRWAQLITNHVYWEDGHSRSRTMFIGNMGTVDHKPRPLGRWAQSITNHVY